MANGTDKTDEAYEGREVAPLTSSFVLSPEQLRDEAQSAGKYRDRSRAANTIRVYNSAIRLFRNWCKERHFTAFPADPRVVATYLAWLADNDRSASTVSIHYSAIIWGHKKEGLPPPAASDERNLIEDVLAGIRRALKVKAQGKTPVQSDHMIRMIEAITGNDTRSYRDRAILAFGLSTAMRRSEIVALTLADIKFVQRGVRVNIASSKGDQTGASEQISIPNGKLIRPAYHLKKWIECRGEHEGPLFNRFDPRGLMTNLPMSDRAIARLVKAYALAADLDPAEVAAHSMRSGFLTDAAEKRASITKMQEVSRHKKIDVLARYVRSAEQLDDHAGADFL